MWPFRLDVSRVSYPEAVRVCLPIVPGAILLTGFIVAHLQLVTDLFKSDVVGYRSKLFLLALAAYVSGLVLVTLSDVVLAVPALAIGFSTRRFLGWATFDQLSKDLVWRKAARQFLGDGVAPGTIEPYTQAVQQQELDRIKQIGDPMGRINESIANIGRSAERVREDAEWTGLYSALRPLFVRPSAQDLISFYTASTFGAIGWAGMIVLAWIGGEFWLLWVAVVLCVVIGLLGAFSTQALGGSFGIDFFSNVYTANLINATRKVPTAP